MSLQEQPWLKFYTGDWRQDGALRMASLSARGLWIEMLALMHEARPRGHLLIGTIKPDVEQLAALVSARASDVEAALGELLALGVYSVSEDGVIYSRRMVRDTQLSETRAQAGRAGAAARHGKGVLLTGLPQQIAMAKPVANAWQVLASSSSSNSSSKKGGAGGGSPGELFPDEPTPAQELARWWMLQIPTYQRKPALIGQHLEKWSADLEKLTRIDGHPWELVEQVVRWTALDDECRGSWRGWSQVVRAPAKLRRANGDGIKYFDVLLERMQQRPHSSKPCTRPEDYDGQEDIN